KEEGRRPLQGVGLEPVAGDVGAVLQEGADAGVAEQPRQLLLGRQIAAEEVPDHHAPVGAPDSRGRTDRENERNYGNGQQDAEDYPKVPLEVPLYPRNHLSKSSEG